MNKVPIRVFARSLINSTRKHSPEILIGIGITGMITSTVLAIHATPKAIILIEERKKKLEVDELNAKETVKATWKCYIPSLATTILSMVCIIGADSVNLRKNAALATAYTLSETALRDYTEKMVETVGEHKAEQIRDAVSKKQVEQVPVNQEVIFTGKGDTYCLDSLQGTPFWSDVDKIKRAVNEANNQMNHDMYISLNELRYAMGLPETELGDLLGWNVNTGLIEVSFSAQLANDGTTPCLVVNFPVRPVYDYDAFY